MYYILTLLTGQPLIMYQEREKILLYSVANGRISYKGLLFDDYKSNMKILNNKYIFYNTTDNQVKIFKIEGEHFIELFTLPSNSKVIQCNEDIFVFYQHQNSLYCIKCSSFNKSILILKNPSKFSVSNLEDFILLKNKETYYKMSADMKISELSFNSDKIQELESIINKNKKEIAYLKATHKNITDQNNELASFVGQLQDELRKYRYV